MGRGSDEKILSYNDVVLRRSDLEILSGPHFLNDRILEFFFSHLSSQHPSRDIALISPSVSFWMANCPPGGGLEDFAGPLDLRAKKLILFPVNDNGDVSRAGGGSHWSLLAYRRDADAFFHHDSLGGANGGSARRLHAAVSGLVSAGGAGFVELTGSPQQTNGYDCGLFVAAVARAVCRWYGEGGGGGEEDSSWVSEVNEKVDPAVVSGMRNEILDLIRGLMAAAE